jgi:hypothetical protein
LAIGTKGGHMKGNTLLIWLLCLLSIIVIFISLYSGIENMFGIMILAAFEAFVIIPLHGKYLSKKCKKGNCVTCKYWNCDNYHKIANV